MEAQNRLNKANMCEMVIVVYVANHAFEIKKLHYSKLGDACIKEFYKGHIPHPE